MIELKNITLVAVACVRVEKTLEALRYSMKDIEFGAAKLFTHEDIKDDKVEIIKIDKMDYIEYNRFIVYELHKQIDTEFALIVQDDGYVINADKWSDEFFKYDFVGAPWILPLDDFSYRDAFGKLVRVGNGGFSLRSKKILSLATELNLTWEPFHGFYNEDGFFTCKNRHIYEKYGCVYAPLDVAKYFSHEAPIPELQGITPFGFHGKGNKLNILNQ